MKVTNEVAISAVDSTSTTSIAYDGNQWFGLSVVAYFTDATAIGTVAIQGSNDIPPAGNLGGAYLNTEWSPTHWATIPSQTITLTSTLTPGTTYLSQAAYRWYRLAYTATTPGSGNVVATIFSQAQ